MNNRAHVSGHGKVVSVLLLLKETIAIVVAGMLIAGALIYQGQRYEIAVAPDQSFSVSIPVPACSPPALSA